MAHGSRYNFKYIGQTFKRWPDGLSFKHPGRSEEDNVRCLNIACDVLCLLDHGEVLFGDVTHNFTSMGHLNTEDAMILQVFRALIEQCGDLRTEHTRVLLQKDAQQAKTVKTLKDKLADEYDRGYEDGVKMHHALNDP